MRTTLDRGRLTAWLALVSVLTLLGYASRAAGGKPPKNAAYQYSTTVSGLIQYAIILGVVLTIARPEWRLLALRRPIRKRGLVTTVVLVFVAVYSVGYLVSLYSNPGREQGLTPQHWDSHRTAPFVVNFVLFTAIAPTVEELTFRGLGYSLLEPLGQLSAVLLIGIAFGLAHGLLEGLPVLIVFGAGLALVRSRSDSVYPGLAMHAAFNAFALIVSVT